MERDVWSSFTHDPRDARLAPLRASDHDRAVVQQMLADAYADGRLDRAEYDERSRRAAEIRLLGDIHPLLGDLVASQPVLGRDLARATPADLQRRAEEAWQRKRREAAYSFLGVGSLTVAIWLATSFRDGAFEPYFFWPAFPIVFALLHLVRTATSRREIVQAEVNRLERQRAKALRRPGWLPPRF